jgi:uncharacterized repeat protein (TIGR01451 family)
VYDASTFAFVALYDTGYTSVGIAVDYSDPSDITIYTTTSWPGYPDTLNKYNINSGVPTPVSFVDSEPTGVTVDPDTEMVYITVGDYVGNPGIEVYDMATMTLQNTVDFPSGWIPTDLFVGEVTFMGTPTMFKIDVCNDGDVDLTGINITDLLPGTLTAVNWAYAQVTSTIGPVTYTQSIWGDGQYCSWEISEALPPDECISIEFGVWVWSCEEPDGNINTATVTTTEEAVGDEDTATIWGICEEECIPSLELTKTVWDDCYWADSTDAETGDIVRFNISIYVPEDGCHLCGGNISDFLPTGLAYIPGTTNITIHYMGETAYVEIEPSQILYSGGTRLVWGEDEFGTLMALPPGMHLYFEFNATVDECDEYNNTAIATTYECDDGCCPLIAEDWAWVYCECEIYATVTSPNFNENINGEESLVITGTAYNDCTCPEIGNVSLALYYTQDDDNENPTLYWNGTSGQWEETTIIYNPVEYVSGGCPETETTLYWTRTVPVPPLFDDSSTYYIHVVAQPEDQNAGVVTSQFTAFIDD